MCVVQAEMNSICLPPEQLNNVQVTLEFKVLTALLHKIHIVCDVMCVFVQVVVLNLKDCSSFIFRVKQSILFGLRH
jgi:hypothetical protein